MSRAFAATIMVLMLVVQTAAAQLSFPLGERYRVGQYLPAHVSGTLSRVATPGMTPLGIPGSGGAVFPVLVTSSFSEASWPNHPLADGERLIGATSPDVELAAALFPNAKLEFASLNLADPLPGPAIAWGALDAVLLDAPAAARVTEAQIVTLLASGTIVAIRSDTQPGGSWPWRRQGPWWVMRPDAPAVDLIQPDRYPPTTAGTPARVRQTITIILIAFALAAIAASLWRSRWAWAAVVLAAVFTTAALVAWRATQPTTAISVSDERSGPWLHRWTRHTAFADGAFSQRIGEADAAWPIFFSSRHMQDIDLRLECAADGTPRAFAGHLKRGQTLVFLSRSRVAQ